MMCFISIKALKIQKDNCTVEHRLTVDILSLDLFWKANHWNIQGDLQIPFGLEIFFFSTKMAQQLHMALFKCLGQTAQAQLTMRYHKITTN
jgi:hypothetical protein